MYVCWVRGRWFPNIAKGLVALIRNVASGDIGIDRAERVVLRGGLGRFGEKVEKGTISDAGEAHDSHL